MERHFRSYGSRRRIVIVVGCLYCLLSFSARGQQNDDDLPEPPVPLPETVVETESAEPATPLPVSDFAQALEAPASFDRGTDLLGETRSASSGFFGQPNIEDRPLLRPAEVLELVPGMIATQHSGSGKANQYFIRGFNLDHGTDFNVRVDGVPINLPTHGHGQGYLDLNWLIPELIDYGQYKLGPYYAEVGDFSAAGALALTLRHELPEGIAVLQGGMFNYYRALLADSYQAGSGTLLYAYESIYNDGPWDVPEGFNKFNGMLRYTVGDQEAGISLSLLGYRSYWTATDQIASPAVAAGIVSRFGSLDPSDGGDTDRATINAELWNVTDSGITRANAYCVYYDLALYSNFTYFLEDMQNGDQIGQIDQRVYSGMQLSHQMLTCYGSHTLGIQFRNDDIYDVALYHTDDRILLDQVSHHNVDQQQYSLYYTDDVQVNDWVRTSVGLRGDWYRFHARDELEPVNSGTVEAAIFSPKLAVVFGPWDDKELFVNWGKSFHSNDARGILNAADPANPLVKSEGSELGLRSQVTPGWVSTRVSQWQSARNSPVPTPLRG